MNSILKDYDKYYIGIETADGIKHCIFGWYADKRCNHKDCPKGYYMYEFRESDDGELYLSTIEPFVWVNHSGTFITRTEIPFGENGNGYRFDICFDNFLNELTDEQLGGLKKTINFIPVLREKFFK